MPRSWGSPPAPGSRPDARGWSRRSWCSAGSGPTRRGRGWAQRHPPAGPGARSDRGLRAAGTRDRRLPLPRVAAGSRGPGREWPATSCPTGPTVVLSHRFAPDRDATEAEASLRAWFEPCWIRRPATRWPSSRPARSRSVPRASRARRPARGHGRHPGPSWAGPTWPSSPNGVSPPPTSVRAIPSWPTPRGNGSDGRTSSTCSRLCIGS